MALFHRIRNSGLGRELAAGCGFEAYPLSDRRLAGISPHGKTRINLVFVPAWFRDAERGGALMSPRRAMAFARIYNSVSATPDHRAKSVPVEPNALLRRTPPNGQRPRTNFRADASGCRSRPRTELPTRSRVLPSQLTVDVIVQRWSKRCASEVAFGVASAKKIEAGRGFLWRTETVSEIRSNRVKAPFGGVCRRLTVWGASDRISFGTKRPRVYR
jgi:hypothetical protein